MNVWGYSPYSLNMVLVTVGFIMALRIWWNLLFSSRNSRTGSLGSDTLFIFILFHPNVIKESQRPPLEPQADASQNRGRGADQARKKINY